MKTLRTVFGIIGIIVVLFGCITGGYFIRQAVEIAQGQVETPDTSTETPGTDVPDGTESEVVQYLKEQLKKQEELLQSTQKQLDNNIKQLEQANKNNQNLIEQNNNLNETIKSLQKSIQDLQNEVTRLTGLIAGYEGIAEGTYTVNFYDNTGEVLIATKVVKKGDCLKETVTAEKEGYRFKGWSKDKQTIIEDIYSEPVAEDTNYYAVMVKVYNLTLINVYDSEGFAQKVGTYEDQQLYKLLVGIQVQEEDGYVVIHDERNFVFYDKNDSDVDLSTNLSELPDGILKYKCAKSLGDAELTRVTSEVAGSVKNWKIRDVDLGINNETSMFEFSWASVYFSKSDIKYKERIRPEFFTHSEIDGSFESRQKYLSLTSEEDTSSGMHVVPGRENIDSLVIKIIAEKVFVELNGLSSDYAITKIVLEDFKYYVNSNAIGLIEE